MSVLMKNNQNAEQNNPDVRKLCESGMRGTMRIMQGKEKSPELRAFLGSGDLTRTDDTPGMNRML